MKLNEETWGQDVTAGRDVDVPLERLDLLLPLVSLETTMMGDCALADMPMSVSLLPQVPLDACRWKAFPW